MYVGQTCVKPEYRWSGGSGYKGSRHFYAAIKKYGWYNFDHDIIASNLNKSEADNFEKLLIKCLKLRDQRFGYNLTDGGEGTLGRIVSEETKKKISEANKGRVASEEQRRSMSERQKGKTLSDETKRKIGESNKGKKHTEEAKKKIGNGNKGKKRSKEHIEVLQKAHLGTKHSEETKRKMSNALIKRNIEHIENWHVAQYDKSGVLQYVYNSVADASDKTGISATSIDNCLAKYSKSAGGYMWLRVDPNNIMNNILPYVKKNRLKTTHDSGNTNMRWTPVCQFDKQNNLIKIWDNMTDAAKSLNISNNNIWKCCHGIDGRKSAGGFLWAFLTTQND